MIQVTREYRDLATDAERKGSGSRYRSVPHEGDLPK